MAPLKALQGSASLAIVLLHVEKRPFFLFFFFLALKHVAAPREDKWQSFNKLVDPPPTILVGESRSDLRNVSLKDSENQWRNFQRDQGCSRTTSKSETFRILFIAYLFKTSRGRRSPNRQVSCTGRRAEWVREVHINWQVLRSKTGTNWTNVRNKSVYSFSIQKAWTDDNAGLPRLGVSS